MATVENDMHEWYEWCGERMARLSCRGLGPRARYAVMILAPITLPALAAWKLLWMLAFMGGIPFVAAFGFRSTST